MENKIEENLSEDIEISENIDNSEDIQNNNTDENEEKNIKEEEDEDDEEEDTDLESSSEDENRKTVAFLRIFAQEGQPERLFPIYEGITTIGRAEGNDINLDYLGVSSYHAKIEVICNEHFIEDLHSTNYTHFGEMPIRPSPKMYQLINKRRIAFGRTQCQYEIVNNTENEGEEEEKLYYNLPNDEEVIKRQKSENENSTIYRKNTKILSHSKKNNITAKKNPELDHIVNKDEICRKGFMIMKNVDDSEVETSDETEMEEEKKKILEKITKKNKEKNENVEIESDSEKKEKEEVEKDENSGEEETEDEDEENNENNEEVEQEEDEGNEKIKDENLMKIVEEKEVNENENDDNEDKMKIDDEKVTETKNDENKMKVDEEEEEEIKPVNDENNMKIDDNNDENKMKIGHEEVVLTEDKIKISMEPKDENINITKDKTSEEANIEKSQIEKEESEVLMEDGYIINTGEFATQPNSVKANLNEKVKHEETSINPKDNNSVKVEDKEKSEIAEEEEEEDNTLDTINEESVETVEESNNLKTEDETESTEVVNENNIIKSKIKKTTETNESENNILKIENEESIETVEESNIKTINEESTETIDENSVIKTENEESVENLNESNTMKTEKIENNQEININNEESTNTIEEDVINNEDVVKEDIIESKDSMKIDHEPVLLIENTKNIIKEEEISIKSEEKPEQTVKENTSMKDEPIVPISIISNEENLLKNNTQQNIHVKEEKIKKNNHHKKASEETNKKTTSKTVLQHNDGESNHKRKHTDSNSQTKSSKKSKTQENELIKEIPRIAFTGIDMTFMDMVRELGGEVVDRWEDCTHLVTDKIRRTVKFLCVLTTGKKIVSINWIKASNRAGKFLDPNKYILKDTVSEKKWSFSIKKSIKLANDIHQQQQSLFNGITFYMTSSTKPPVNDMKEIINAAGGTLIEELPESCQSDLIILGCKEDESICKEILLKGYKNLFTNEFILSGILKQTVDYESYKLDFSNKETNNTEHRGHGGRKRRK